MSGYIRKFRAQTHMPEQVMILILLKLPPKSVVRFKCVSKTWHALINSPYFNQHYFHFSNSNSIRIIHYPEKDNHVPSISKQASLIGPDDLVLDIKDAPFLRTPHQLGLHCCIISDSKEVRTVDDKEFQSAMWGPINGVYCIMIKARLSGRSTLLLWSPGVKQFHVLPPIPAPVFPPTITKYLEHNGFEQQHMLCGYGYDLLTNDYKIILTNVYGDRYDEPFHHYCFNLYSLATNTWQQLDPFQIVKDKSILEVYDHSGGIVFKYNIDTSLFGCWDDGVYSTGACHWLITNFNYRTKKKRKVKICGYSLLSFNFRDVAFQVTPIPSRINEGKKYDPTLELINGCLALVFPLDVDTMNGTSSAFDVCVMREYGVEDSWIAAYKIVLTSPGELVGTIHDEFFVRENDDGNGKVVSYRLGAGEPGKERSEWCYYDDDWIKIIPYEESFVSVVPPKI